MRISAFFPCFNEEKNLTDLVLSCDKVLRGICDDYEIIIVDDGSTDGTTAVVQELQRQYPKLQYVRHPKNHGYGGAVYTGFKKSRFEYIFFSDGDNQFNLEEIPLLVKKISEADLVTGFRHQRADPLMRHLIAWVYRLAVRIVFGLGITDIDCAFKLFKRSTLQRIDIRNIVSKGALINTEIYARMKKLNMTVIEVPVTHYARLTGKQTGASPKVILRAMLELVSLSFKLRREGLQIHTEKPPRVSESSLVSEVR